MHHERAYPPLSTFVYKKGMPGRGDMWGTPFGDSALRPVVDRLSGLQESCTVAAISRYQFRDIIEL
jgi:hypothetical protein